MASNKDAEFKERLIARSKSNKSAPIWAIMKTNRSRKVRSNPKRYHWRSSHLGEEIRYSMKKSRGE